MSKTIEFPDALYEELAEVAAADGTTPLGWIAARLRLLRGPQRVDGTASGQTLAERFAGRAGVVASLTGQPGSELIGVPPAAAPPKTMAERLAGRLGRVGSGTGQPPSDTVGRSFGEYLEEKQRNGRL